MKIHVGNFIHKYVFVGDNLVWGSFLALLFISVVEVYSASSNMTYGSNDFWSPVLSHGKHIVMGLVACSFILNFNMDALKVCAIIANFFSLLLLFCALLLGGEVNGTSRWIFGMQPSEVAKGVLVMTVALILSQSIDVNKRRVTTRGFKWCVFLTVLNCLLIMPENLSTAILTFSVAVMMMIIGRVDRRMLVVTIGPVVLAAVLGFAFMKTASMETIKNVSEISVMGGKPLHRLPTWAGRLQNSNTKYEAAKYPINEKWQVAHAKIAIASSGLTGRGPGNSVERDYLPQAYSDFIFAIIIEEGGLLGAMFVLLLYGLILYQVGSISLKCDERFPQLLAMGLALLIVTQAVVNFGVAVGLLPVTGQQLPLVSRGGTGTILNCCYIGMILAVTRFVQKRNALKEAQGNYNRYD